MAQQLAEAEAPGQGSAREQAAQGAQAEQQRAAEQQGGEQAAAEQTQRQFKVQAQAPHDQAQGQQRGAIYQPAAGGHGQQVAAQYAQRRHAPQGGQRWQGKAREGYQSSRHSSDCRQQAARRHARRQQALQQFEQHQLAYPAKQGASEARQQPEHGQLQAKETQRFAA